MIWLVGLAGGFGAVARWLVTAWFAGRSRLGTGTAIVNTFGSLGLGFVIGLARDDRVSADVLVVVGVGLLGSLTTFSTWMVETAEAGDQHAATVLVRTVPLVVAGVGLAWLGMAAAGFK